MKSMQWEWKPSMLSVITKQPNWQFSCNNDVSLASNTSLCLWYLSSAKCTFLYLQYSHLQKLPFPITDMYHLQVLQRTSLVVFPVHSILGTVPVKIGQTPTHYVDYWHTYIHSLHITQSTPYTLWLLSTKRCIGVHNICLNEAVS